MAEAILLSTARRQYRAQRKSARERNIEWLLTFDEWFGLWRASGMYAMRGRGKGRYCMARYGDVGPYSPENVYITTCDANVRDYYDAHRAEHSKLVRAGSIRRSARDARGWTLVKGRITKPYQVMWSSKYIGSFATQQEAEAAHRHARELAALQ